jgi:pimeloyl-ACP methyl ester carboxylesterase
VAAADAVAAEAGVRLISPDRPGVGLSDPQPGRTVLDCARDVAELLDQIGVDHFAVMGWSMGGQYAAAVGHALHQRVTRVAIIAGTRDELVNPSWPHRLALRIPNATLNIRDGGHFMAHLYYREIFAALTR